MKEKTVSIDRIQPGDNSDLAAVIRTTLKEFGADRPGTVYYDETTDHLYELFSNQPRSVYYVARHDKTIVGGGGIYPSPGLPADVCELVKMYLLPVARGTGLGSRLISQSIAFAKEKGYKQIYLETMPELKQALSTYAKFGFEYIDHPMGNTGHFGCGLWMLKTL